MNPLTNVKNISRLSEQALIKNTKTSWHDQYRRSAWIFVGGLPYDLTEGDIICIFSQYGEIVNINLIRDKDTGKSKGFGFICYEDQRSTDLSVDNLNGIKILGRTVRVDHVEEYKAPQEGKKTDEQTRKLYQEGCAPKAQPVKVEQPVVALPPQDLRETLADQVSSDAKLPLRLPIYIKLDPNAGSSSNRRVSDDDAKEDKRKRHKKDKRKKKKKHKKSHKKRCTSESSDSDSASD